MDEWHAGDSTELPEDFAALIKPELYPGERLIWAARSRPILLNPWWELFGVLLCSLAAMGIGVLCFALAFGAVGGALGRAMQDSGTTLAVLGFILGLIGIAGFLGVIVRSIQHPPRGVLVFRSTYALTNRRAIIWRPRSWDDGVEVFSIDRHAIRGVHRVEFPGGGGSVMLQCSDILPYDSPGGFLGIGDPRQVEAYARQTFLLDPVV
jgi:hypothetical protein